jgi:hypothetical protein
MCRPSGAQTGLVGGLEVAMDDAVLVGGAHRVDQRQREARELPRRQAASGDQAGERLALHQLHREEVDAVGVLDRVDGDDIGVVQRGNRLGLALEAPEAVGVGRHLQRQDLEGDTAVQPGVFGGVDLTHSAFAERGDDVVVAEPRAWTKPHGGLRPAIDQSIRLWRNDGVRPGGVRS